MSTMVCERCNCAGIYWASLGLDAYTYCPTCGGRNCQRANPEPDVDDEDGADDEVLS
jgi:hypothetical protein